MKLKKIKQFFIWTIHINIIFLFLGNLTLITGSRLLLRDKGYIYQINVRGTKRHYWKCRLTNCKGSGNTDIFELIEDKQGNICEYEVNAKNEDGSFEATRNIDFALTTKHNHQRNII